MMGFLPLLAVHFMAPFLYEFVFVNSSWPRKEANLFKGFGFKVSLSKVLLFFFKANTHYAWFVIYVLLLNFEGNWYKDQSLESILEFISLYGFMVRVSKLFSSFLSLSYGY